MLGRMTSDADSADALAGRLLQAHTRHTVDELLRPETFRRLVDEEIDGFYAEAGTMPLEQAMPRALIKAVAAKYTVQFPVEGAIPELVGRVAARLYRHDVNRGTRLADVLDTRSFDELAVTLAEMPLSRRAVRTVLESPVTVDLAAEMAQRAVEHRFGASRSRWRRVLDARLERMTRWGAGMVLDAAREDSDVLLLDAAREFWRGHAQENIEGFRESVNDDDVEDTVVLVFEFWRTFRHTEYFQVLLDAGIDEVFDTYGGTPLADVLADLGIHREDLIEEALRFGPPVIERLHAAGFLEASVRRRLAPFYDSPEFRAALAGD